MFDPTARVPPLRGGRDSRCPTIWSGRGSSCDGELRRTPCEGRRDLPSRTREQAFTRGVTSEAACPTISDVTHDPDNDLDALYNLPPHPGELSDFSGRASSHPLGIERYMKRFRAALESYWDSTSDTYKRIIPPDEHISKSEYINLEILKHLRRQVTSECNALASRAGIHERDLAHNLVKMHGFPWRRDCSYSDLIRLYHFIIDPRAVDLVRDAPRQPSLEERAAAADDYWRERGVRP